MNDDILIQPFWQGHGDLSTSPKKQTTQLKKKVTLSMLVLGRGPPQLCLALCLGGLWLGSQSPWHWPCRKKLWRQCVQLQESNIICLTHGMRYINSSYYYFSGRNFSVGTYLWVQVSLYRNYLSCEKWRGGNWSNFSKSGFPAPSSTDHFLAISRPT